MRSLRLFGLGVKLSIAGGRAAVVRLVLMSMGLAIGATLLLGALGVEPALRAYDRRQEERTGIVLQEPSGGVQDATLRSWIGTTFEGRDVSVVAVRGIGQPPIPPGIPRLPGPGEVFASPALAQLLADPGAALLRPRVPGRIDGTIAPEGLLEPQDLIAYVGTSRQIDPPRSWMETVTSFTPAASGVAPVDLAAIILLVVSVLAVLVPIALFVLTATRLSASTREARLAAVRLAGATQAQVRLLAAAENAVPAIAGAVLAIPSFVLARGAGIGTLARIVGHGFFVSDLTPPAPAVFGVLVGLPLFAVAVAVLTLRRVVVSPLGIVRRSRQLRRGWYWPVILGAGLLALGITTLERGPLLRLSSPIPGVLIGATLLAILIGLAGSAPWLGWLAARALGASRAPTSILLGARRLEAEPTSAGRVVVSVAVLVALAAVGEAIFLSASETYAMPPGLAALEPNDVVARSFGHYPQRVKTWSSLEQVPGVEAVHVSNRLPDYGTCGRACIAVVDTDGNPDTVERIRNALGLEGYAQTAAEARGEATSNDWSRIARLLLLAMLFVLVVTAANLLLSTIDGMMERRRPLAILSAIGVPAGVIRRSVLFQVALPLGAALVLGGSVGLAVTTLVFKIASEPVFLPIRPLVLTAAAAGVAVLLVTAAALPWVRVVRRPELLRSE